MTHLEADRAIRYCVQYCVAVRTRSKVSRMCLGMNEPSIDWKQTADKISINRTSSSSMQSLSTIDSNFLRSRGKSGRNAFGAAVASGAVESSASMSMRSSAADTFSTFFAISNFRIMNCEQRAPNVSHNRSRCFAG